MIFYRRFAMRSLNIVVKPLIKALVRIRTLHERAFLKYSQ